MRQPFYLGLATVLSGLVSLHVSAQPPDSTLVARLQAAEHAQSLDDPALKPWHLKMTVQLYNKKGKPTEAGTIEEWFAGPDRTRRIITTPSYTATQLTNSDGYFYSGNSGPAPQALELLLQQVLHPVRSYAGIRGVYPRLRQQKINNTELDCIDFEPHVAGDPNPPPGLFPGYCFAKDGNRLLVSYEGIQVTLIDAGGKFQDRDVPIDLSILIGGTKAASGHVQTLEIVPESAGNFDVTTGLTLNKSQ